MHPKIASRWFSNLNPDCFMPENLPIHVLTFMIYENTPESINLVVHGATVLFCTRFGLKFEQVSKEQVFSTFFRSCLSKYAAALKFDLAGRISKKPLPPKTIDAIFSSNFGSGATTNENLNIS